MGPDSEKLDGRYGLSKEEYEAAFLAGYKVGENMKEFCAGGDDQKECPGVFPSLGVFPGLGVLWNEEVAKSNRRTWEISEQQAARQALEERERERAQARTVQSLDELQRNTFYADAKERVRADAKEAVREMMKGLDVASPTEEEIFSDKAITDLHYATLRHVLDRAYQQAAEGKGAERHGQDLPFDQQPMQRLIDLHGPGFATGQIGKKAQETLRLPTDRAVHELLGVIVYAAGLVVWLERREDA